MIIQTDLFQYELVPDFLQVPDEEKTKFGVVSAVGVDRADRIYVYARGNPKLSVWTSTGEKDQTIHVPGFTSAHGIWIRHSNGDIFCTDQEAHCVFHLDASGKLIEVLGTPGLAGASNGEPFNQPTDCCLDEQSGILYVSDGYGNTNVHGFQAGRRQFTWGERGSGREELILPHCVRLDGQQRVWVCDRENNRVVIHDTNGKVLDLWEGLLRPAGLWLDVEHGHVYIAELDYRMSIFSMEGELLARWKTEELGLAGYPHGICVDSVGSIYVAHTMFDGSVVKYQRV